MDLLKIKLDCEEWTDYRNLEAKSGKIQCPECKDHEIDVEACLNMISNREIIKRAKIEEALDENIKQDLSIQLNRLFDDVINQIDLQCENVIKEVNEYRSKLI